MADIITKDTFEDRVLKAGGPVLVDFFATWCGPCRMLAPILEEAAGDHPEIDFCKLDVDQAQELAVSYGVMSIPTLILFRSGEPVRQSVGLLSRDELEEFLGSAV